MTGNVYAELRGYINKVGGLAGLNNDGVLPLVRGGTEAKNPADALTKFGLTVTASEINASVSGGGGEFLTKEEVVDPPLISPLDYYAVDVTVTGCILGNPVILGAGANVSDILVSATVTAADTVTIVFFNPRTGSINIASSTWIIKVLQ